MFVNVNKKKLKSIVLILLLFNGFFVVLLDFSFLDGVFKDLFQYDLKTSAGDTTDFVDQISNLHAPTDVGTHSLFSNVQSYPDSVYDTLEEEDIGQTGTNYNYFVTQTSNLHDPADIGSHSDFTEMQDEDEIYDTLTEANTGGAGGSEWLDVNAFDSTFTEWDNNQGVSPWLGATSDGHYLWELSSDSKQQGWFDFPSTTLTGSLTVNISGYVQNSDGTGNDHIEVFLDYTAGGGASVGDFDCTTSWAYDTITLGGTYTPAEVNAMRIWLDTDMAGQGDDVYIDHLRLGVSAPAGDNYQLDLEVGWTGIINYGETNEELCIYGGTQGSESLEVDVWDGSWVNVISDVAAGWNNVSITSYLDSSTFEIRFVDNDKTSDTNQETWQIDTVKIHAWTVDTTDYELDLEEGWTALTNYDENNEELCIYGGTQGVEALRVDVWDGSWVNVITDLQADQWNNVSILSYLTTSSFEIRFVDTDKDTDTTTQETWEIDTVLIHTWTVPTEEDPPTWDTLTESVDPLELGNNETIHINVYDASTISNVYLEYDNVNHSMNFESGDTYNYTNWKPASVGLKEYQIHMIDEFNNINQTTDLNITVQDTTDPVIYLIEESADPLELGQTETITCYVLDNSSMEFVYLEFEGSNHSMNPGEGDDWLYGSWIPTSVGNYPYTIWANDTEGNIASNDTGDITVIDTSEPVIDAIEESADPLELGQTETIQCNVTDYSPIEWVYLEFEGSNHSMSFVSGVTWEYTSWTPLAIGDYNYEIYANDSEGNIGDTTHIFGQFIIVQDTTDPVINNVQESADPLELGQTETIECDITDESSMEFVYLEFDGSNHSMSFVSGVKWEYTSWTPTSVGIKNYKIWANDTEGNINSYSGDITVEDTTDPVIDNVQESADPLELGNTETIQCDITDESSMEFVYLEFDGSNHSMSFVSGITWEYTAWTPSSVGLKNYKIWANDTSGNIVSYDGSITVQDTTDPVIDNVQESADPLELGQTETIECDITDESEMYFVYLEFGGVNYSMSIKAGITWEYTAWVPTSVGLKGYTIWANDTEGNINSYGGSITVQDTTDPVINNVQESADPLELGQTEIIECDITDESSMTFVYLEFGGVNYSMSFKSGITWEYTTWTPTSVGLKNYIIWANDTEGNVNSYYGDITVEDTTDPVIDNVQESADPLELGQTETIECDVTDESEMYFVYLEFGGSNHSMSFKSGITWEYTTWVPISIGLNNYKIWANDTEGNIVSYEGSITVEDTTDPVIDNVIESADPLQLGDIETITCDITDELDMYFVYLEFEGANHSMSFVSGITWEYDSWEPPSEGDYPYTIWANDTEGNIASYDGSITVVADDIIPPTWDNLVEISDPLEFGNTMIFRINTTDSSGISSVWIEYDSTNHSMVYMYGDMWNYTTWQPSSVGIKYYTIYMNDTFDNWNNTGQQSFTVQDTTDPVINNVQESADPLELGNTETIQCDVTDLSTPFVYVYLEFGGVNYSMSFVSGDTWEYTSWIPTSVGLKNYKIWAEDSEGNIAEYNGDITVQDITNPVIDNVQESADPLELGATETIQCDITDESDMYFVYLEFGGVNYSMSFVSGITWEYTSWLPTTVGLKNYKIWANDTEGNIVSYDGSITVEDTTDPVIDNVVESADPLELGQTETIECDITDESNMEFVYLEFDGSNHSMSFVSGITWEYTTWTPTSVDLKNYKIWAKDTEGNIAEYNGDITIQDTIAPTWDTLTESDDPLELGDNETIHINAYDIAGIELIYLEYGGNNYSMVFEGGNTWNYTNWLPTSVGNKPYTIHIKDNSGLWNSTSDSITVQDSFNPTWDTLSESADPLELGATETIEINAYDVAGIELIYLEYGGVNYSMSFVSGNTWRYNTWTPTSIGNKPYEIHIKDNSGNWNSTSGSIDVQDTTIPDWSNLIESADPLPLGDNETISIDVTDASGIDQVLLEFEGANHSMNYISGNTWRYTNWKPTSVGVYFYNVWFNDSNGLWNNISGSIEVSDMVDTTPPTWNNLIVVSDYIELGCNVIMSIDVFDPSGINQVLLRFRGRNYSMSNIGGNTWRCADWRPSTIGVKNYIILMEDNNNNWNSTSGSITVIEVVVEPPDLPPIEPDLNWLWMLFLIFFIIFCVVLIGVVGHFVYEQLTETEESTKRKKLKKEKKKRNKKKNKIAKKKSKEINKKKKEAKKVKDKKKQKKKNKKKNKITKKKSKEINKKKSKEINKKKSKEINKKKSKEINKKKKEAKKVKDEKKQKIMKEKKEMTNKKSKEINKKKKEHNKMVNKKRQETNQKRKKRMKKNKKNRKNIRKRNIKKI